MDDLISRQAAIDSIEKHLRFGDELYPLTDTDKVLNHAFSIAASCVYNLPSAQPERKTGRWIPCSERLPELDEDGYSDKVLVCFSNFTGCEVCEYRECDDCHGWYVGDSDDNPEDVGVHVIAWMPLPEPYREGEG